MDKKKILLYEQNKVREALKVIDDGMKVSIASKMTDSGLKRKPHKRHLPSVITHPKWTELILSNDKDNSKKMISDNSCEEEVDEPDEIPKKKIVKSEKLGPKQKKKTKVLPKKVKSSKKDDDTAECVYCHIVYKDDRSNAGWMRCTLCGKWVHEKCGSQPWKTFTCKECPST